MSSIQIIGESPISPKTTSSFSIASLITSPNIINQQSSASFAPGGQLYEYSLQSIEHQHQSSDWFHQRNNMDGGMHSIQVRLKSSNF